MLLVLPVIIHMTSQQKDEDGENLGYELVFLLYSLTLPLPAPVYPVSGDGSWKTCRSKIFLSEITSRLVLPTGSSTSAVPCDQVTLGFLEKCAELDSTQGHPTCPRKRGSQYKLQH